MVRLLAVVCISIHSYCMSCAAFVFTEGIVDVFSVPVTMATECIFSAGPASLTKMPAHFTKHTVLANAIAYSKNVYLSYQWAAKLLFFCPKSV